MNYPSTSHRRLLPLTLAAALLTGPVVNVVRAQAAPKPATPTTSPKEETITLNAFSVMVSSFGEVVGVAGFGAACARTTLTTGPVSNAAARVSGSKRRCEVDG